MEGGIFDVYDQLSIQVGVRDEILGTVGLGPCLPTTTWRLVGHSNYL